MHLITHAPLLTDALCLRFVCVVCARCVYGCVCCVAFAWATCISPELPLSLLNCLFTIVDGKVTWLSRWCFQPSDWYAQHNSALFTRIQSYIHTLHALTQTRTQLSWTSTLLESMFVSAEFVLFCFIFWFATNNKPIRSFTCIFCCLFYFIRSHRLSVFVHHYDVGAHVSAVVALLVTHRVFNDPDCGVRLVRGLFLFRGVQREVRSIDQSSCCVNLCVWMRAHRIFIFFRFFCVVIFNLQIFMLPLFFSSP